MKLSRKSLHEIALTGNIETPAEKIFSLPERVIQFGSGALLRALPDYYIDEANKAGIFNGRIVVVQSTQSIGEKSFHDQNCLYTLILKGTETGKPFEKKIINSSISRVLSASSNWADILKSAGNDDLRIVLSNTTERGFEMQPEKIDQQPPKSYPAKLTAFLFERFKYFNGSSESGMIIIPTELVVDNGIRLKEMVLGISDHNQLGNGFRQWIVESNVFCNSLVDRIVPGIPSQAEHNIIEHELGYSDDLLTTAEPYGLWAIESTDPRVHKALEFACCDGIIISDHIGRYRELKLRILNGGHSFCCGLALLLGFTTVKEALNDDQMGLYVRRLLTKEAAAALDNNLVSPEEAIEFARKVVDRFENPFVDHLWTTIASQYISKVVIRCIPMLVSYYKKYSTPPEDMIFGFTSFLYYVGSSRNSACGTLPPPDEAYDTSDISGSLLLSFSDAELWKVDLNALPGFRDQVQALIQSFISNGVQATFRLYLDKIHPHSSIKSHSLFNIQ